MSWCLFSGVYLCWNLFMDERSWCNFVWQVTVTLYYSSSPRQRLNYINSVNTFRSLTMRFWHFWLWKMNSGKQNERSGEKKKKNPFLSNENTSSPGEGGGLSRGVVIPICWTGGAVSDKGVSSSRRQEARVFTPNTDFDRGGPRRAGTVMFDLDSRSQGSVCFWHPAYIGRGSWGKEAAPPYRASLLIKTLIAHDGTSTCVPPVRTFFTFSALVF